MKNKIDERLINALKPCISKELIEDTFKIFEIEDILEKIDYLNKCMGNPQTFFSCGTPENEEKYELTIQMFLVRAWELNDLYNQLTFPKKSNNVSV